MVRHYVRKTSRGAGGNWSMENMRLAIAAVKAKTCSKNKAAADFGVPEPTLRRYLAKEEHQFPVSSGRFRPVFNSEKEKALVDYLLELSNRFFGMTTEQVRRLAFEFAERNGVRHTFDRNLRMAGVDWLASFRERHKSLLALRSPEMTSLGRIQGFNEAQTHQFFSLLRDLYKKHNFLPSRIYNVDETGVPTVPTKLPRVFSAKGAKRVAKVVSSERGKTVTLICNMNAVGNFVPPAFVFPRKNMRYEFLDSAPTESIGFAQKTGWMTQELFPQYLEHFVKHTHASVDDPVLLVLDNHSSHLSIAAIDYCRQHGVVMLTLPPHSSHMMQPLDVTFFGPFKTYYSQACDNWMVNHPGRPITECQTGFLVKQAYDRAATVGIAVKGFQETGIWPYNPSVFTATHFAPSLASDRPQQPARAESGDCGTVNPATPTTLESPPGM